MRNSIQSSFFVALVLISSSLVGAEPPAAQPADPWWLGSKAGVSREVLSPWTPVEAAGANVKVWGRTYEFGTLPLPSVVVTRDAEVIAVPIALRGAADGKELSWTGPGCRVVEARPDAARIAGTAESGNLRCEGTATIEYDGMIRCDLRLLPNSGKATIERLVLEMPVEEKYASYLHFWPGRWGSVFNSAELPKDGYHGEFRPFFWLGDEWRGMSWFCESDQNFFNPKDSNAVEIERKDGVVVLRVNLVTEPQTIDRPLEYTFGFQATPVKPMTPDAWDYRIYHFDYYGIEDEPYTPPGGKPTTVLAHLARLGVRTLEFHQRWADIQAYPATSHEKELKKVAAACRRENIKLILYLGFSISDAAPEWAEYGEKCLVLPKWHEYKRTDPVQTAHPVCYRSEWQDFIAAHLEKLVEQYDLDGIYLDGTSEPWACRNTAHGCGYKRPDGSIGITYPIFAVRRMMKRIYTIVRRHDPQGQVNVHQSACMVIPTLSFATSYWDGEQIQHLKRRKAPGEVLPLDAFRCEFTGRNWGVPAELIEYEPKGPLTWSEAMALALLHDVPLRPFTVPEAEEFSRLWKAFDDFGRREAAWLPYWENAKYVAATPEQVKVSLYNRPGKGFIAVVVNTGNKACRAEAAFDLAALKQPSKLTAHDVLTGKELPLAEGRLTLPLEPLGFVVFRAEGVSP